MQRADFPRSSLEEVAPWLDVRPVSFEEKYSLGELRGLGAFHAVREVTNLRTGRTYACKRSQRDTESAKDILNEASILRRLSHTNIVKCYDVLQDGKHVYLVTTMLPGATLQQAVTERGSYAEEDARAVIKQILSAIAHMHSLGVAHRDLKPENVMLSCELDHTAVTIIDFGLSVRTTEKGDSMMLSTPCGTPLYTAPEVFEGRYGLNCDVWSAGIILHVLLSGYPPFVAASISDLYSVLKSCKLFMDPVWQVISPEAADLVSRLLTVDPQLRCSAEEALRHPWLSDT
eukprot:CAMPEP_0117677646 /NCGR_PEP_ID=MMETSP0804-20121206/16856_1 /TAXON_ID=1074897 /ORGANISM="Tetraselmis astigmatica, Strain CCMP880" /LENGTH=287 /DNA_ID=CAMNT_0005486943 /DNA_START=187 /DNA_END=1050 /DNA_ORIENTATION=-